MLGVIVGVATLNLAFVPGFVVVPLIIKIVSGVKLVCICNFPL